MITDAPARLGSTDGRFPITRESRASISLIEKRTANARTCSCSRLSVLITDVGTTMRFCRQVSSIARDYPGFGNSSAPLVSFEYTSTSSGVMASSQRSLGSQTSLLMQDYGRPFGFRRRSPGPNASPIIIQNRFLKKGLSLWSVQKYWADPART